MVYVRVSPTPSNKTALEDEVLEVRLEDENERQVHVERLHRHPRQRRQQREVHQRRHHLKH